MESVVLNATGFSDSINVQSTAAGARVTINALAGNDVTVLGAPTAALLKTVNFIASLVTLNAGAGSDTLTVDDTGDPTNNTGTVSISGVQGFGMAQGVSHSQTESIRIFTSSGNDFVKNSVPFGSGIAVFIDLDGGEDGVVFDGTAGNDRIRIRREVGPEGARAIAEINGQLFVNDYLNGEIVVVHAGAGNDHVVMDDTAAFRWSADFLGEDGNDHLVGNAQNDRLDGGQGNDILEGLAGDDVLVGGPGVDLFIGGDGADQIFAADGDLDVIFADIADVLLSIDRKDRVIRR
jgi:Ca2+-binding RTX toxin-like protein